jgi:hypothetical protein
MPKDLGFTGRRLSPTMNDATGTPLKIGDQVAWASTSYGLILEEVIGFTPKRVKLKGQWSAIDPKKLVKTFKQQK